jgi:hypothetical protein
LAAALPRTADADAASVFNAADEDAATAPAAPADLAAAAPVEDGKVVDERWGGHRHHSSAGDGGLRNGL